MINHVFWVTNIAHPSEIKASDMRQTGHQLQPRFTSDIVIGRHFSAAFSLANGELLCGTKGQDYGCEVL